MGDWTAILSLGSLVIAGLALLSKTFDKSLSIREHEEFRNNVNRKFDEFSKLYQREADRLGHRIELLEQTRPTTGEIEAKLDRTQGSK